MSEADPEGLGDTLRILIATDLHVGFKEREAIRGEDSFLALEEVLQTAKAQKVDFLLLGGDLFHENHPSRAVMHRTMQLFRQYCVGDGAVNIQVLSDPLKTFVTPDVFPFANFEDPNHNIDLPVFSIHGNHDDPSREGARQSLAAIDVLSMANLINYFGKCERVDDVDVVPVLIKKGTTKLALYGLGSMRDERLNRMFRQEKVKFRLPDNDSEYFKILVIHQNHNDTGRGKSNCIPESFLPAFMDLVIWGHEHESLIDPKEGPEGKAFHVIQPGSTVATSLIPAEAAQKHMGLLEVKGSLFRVNGIPLKMVRPFAYKEICLGDEAPRFKGTPHVAEAVTSYLEEVVDGLLEDLKPVLEEYAADPKRAFLKLPLVRVKVENTEFPTVNNQRFGSRFESRVANPTEILSFHHRARKVSGKGTVKVTTEDGKHAPVGGGAGGDIIRVEDLIVKELQKSSDHLHILMETGLTSALEGFVLKNESHAIEDFVNGQLNKVRHVAQKRLTGVAAKEDVLRVAQGLVEEARRKEEQASEAADAKQEEVAAASKKRSRTRAVPAALASVAASGVDAAASGLFDSTDSESDADVGWDDAVPRAGVSGRLPAPAPVSTSAPKRGRHAAVLSDEDDDVDEVDEAPPPAKRVTTKRAVTTKPRATSSRAVDSDVDEFDDVMPANEDDEEFGAGSDDDGVANKRKPAAKKPRSKPVTAAEGSAGIGRGRGRAKATATPSVSTTGRGRGRGKTTGQTTLDLSQGLSLAPPTPAASVPGAKRVLPSFGAKGSSTATASRAPPPSQSIATPSVVNATTRSAGDAVLDELLVVSSDEERPPIRSSRPQAASSKPTQRRGAAMFAEEDSDDDVGTRPSLTAPRRYK